MVKMKKSVPLKEERANLKIRVTPMLKRKIEEFIKRRKKDTSDGKWNINTVIITAVEDWINAWD